MCSFKSPLGTEVEISAQVSELLYEIRSSHLHLLGLPHRMGQKEVYSWKYAKHRVYARIITYQLLCFPYK